MNTISIKQILEDNSLPPEEMIGRGILIYKSLLLITGEPKSKKSFFGYDLASALATGESFAIFDINKRYRVLILAAEGGYYPNRDRIQKIFNSVTTDDKVHLDICINPRIFLDDDDNLEDLTKLIKLKKPDVLLIDPFIKFHQKEENSANEMGEILNRLRNLIEEHNLSIILIHHLGKNPLQGARGSSAIIGEYDSCINIQKDAKKMKNRHKFTFDLRHSISPEGVDLIFNDQTYWFEYDSSPVLQILEEYGPMVKKDLVDLLVEDEYYKHESGAYKSIDKELEKGTIYLDDEELYHIKKKEVQL